MTQISTPKIAVVTGIIVCSVLCMGLIVKQAINQNKPQIQKVQIVNYGEILEAVEKEKKEILDSIKQESKELRQQNEMLLAKLNTKPKVVIQREIQKEINHTNSNQIVISEKYTPNYHVIQKKSGTLEIIE